MKFAHSSKLSYLLFGKEPGAGRKIYIDYLRLLATVFVICVHTFSLARDQYVPGTTVYQTLEFATFIFTISNLLFVMISGALLLPVRGESASDFFRKRFSKIVIPLLVYYLLYIFAKQGIEPFYPRNWMKLIQRILIGPPVEAPHFWLVYTIFWLYVLTPFLRYLVSNIPDSVMNGVMGVLFAMTVVDTYAPLFSVTSPFSGIVDTFAIVFVFGYYLTNRCSKRVEWLVFVGGIASVVLTGCLIFYTADYGDYIFNNAPTMILAAGAVVVLVKHLVSDEHHESLFTRLIAKYSFSILMIHWGVLHVVVKKMLHVDVTSGGIVGGCLLMVVLTFVISTVGAVIVDNTVVLAVRTILSGIGRGIAKYFKRK